MRWSVLRLVSRDASAHESPRARGGYNAGAAKARRTARADWESREAACFAARINAQATKKRTPSSVAAWLSATRLRSFVAAHRPVGSSAQAPRFGADFHRMQALQMASREYQRPHAERSLPSPASFASLSRTPVPNGRRQKWATRKISDGASCISLARAIDRASLFSALSAYPSPPPPEDHPEAD